MKFNIQAVLAMLFFHVCTLSAADSIPPAMLEDEKNVELVVNNRVLAIVDDKPITVLDLTKKMDMLFYQEYPDYYTSKIARYQFYLAVWKNMLEQQINENLILSELEENRMPITAADIRQEMETRFGPNIIENLDKLGIPIDEARKIMKDEITIRRVMQSFSNKGLKEATPQTIKKRYQIYAVENEKPAEWTYRVVSIRDKNRELCEEIAKETLRLLQEESIPLDILKEKLKKNFTVPESMSINISNDFRQNENEISSLYKEVLPSLAAGQFSKPLWQKGRKDGKNVCRILCMKESTQREAPPFDKVASELKEKIIQETIEKETGKFLSKIRSKHSIDSFEQQNLPENFSPFALLKK